MSELFEKAQLMEAKNSLGRANRTDKESNSASGWEKLVEKIQLTRPLTHWHTPSTIQRHSTGATVPTGGRIEPNLFHFNACERQGAPNTGRHHKVTYLEHNDGTY